MRMYREAALTRLVDLIYDHRDKPAGTVFEMWRNELIAYEEQKLAQQKALREANPPRYGLVYGEVFIWSDAGGGDTREYRPVLQLYFTESQIPEVAKKNGLSVKIVWQLIRGEVYEHKGWRGLNGRGLSNGVYIPKNTERLAMQAQIQREDIEIQKHVAQYKPYVAAKQPRIEDYTK